MASRLNEKYRKDVCFNDRVENILLNYAWPGNVRELENMIHSIVVTSTKSRISCRDLPDSLATKCDASGPDALVHHVDLGRKSLKDMVQSIERSIIAEALEVYGSATKAAEMLQVNRSTLFRKMGGAASEGVQDGKRRGKTS